MPYTETGVGYRNTDTSAAAAAAIEPKAGTIKAKVLDYLHAHPFPMTSEEIAAGLNIHYRSVQPRLAELRNDNRVKDSGTRKIGMFGKDQIAWEIA